MPDLFLYASPHVQQRMIVKRNVLGHGKDVAFLAMLYDNTRNSPAQAHMVFCLSERPQNTRMPRER